MATKGSLRVTLIRSTIRFDTAVMRRLDLDERHLVISCPWDATTTDILTALQGLLTEVERVELEAALREGP